MGQLDNLKIEEQLLDLQLEEAELDKQILTAEFESGLSRDFPPPAQPGFPTAEPASTMVPDLQPQILPEVTGQTPRLEQRGEETLAEANQIRGEEFKRWKSEQPFGWGSPEGYGTERIVEQLEKEPIQAEMRPIEEFNDDSMFGGSSAYDKQLADYKIRQREVTGKRDIVGKTLGDVMNAFRSGRCNERFPVRRTTFHL